MAGIGGGPNPLGGGWFGGLQGNIPGFEAAAGFIGGLATTSKEMKKLAVAGTAAAAAMRAINLEDNMNDLRRYTGELKRGSEAEKEFINNTNNMAMALGESADELRKLTVESAKALFMTDVNNKQLQEYVETKTKFNKLTGLEGKLLDDITSQYKLFLDINEKNVKQMKGMVDVADSIADTFYDLQRAAGVTGDDVKEFGTNFAKGMSMLQAAAFNSEESYEDLQGTFGKQTKKIMTQNAEMYKSLSAKGLGSYAKSAGQILSGSFENALEKLVPLGASMNDVAKAMLSQDLPAIAKMQTTGILNELAKIPEGLEKSDPSQYLLRLQTTAERAGVPLEQVTQSMGMFKKHGKDVNKTWAEMSKGTESSEKLAAGWAQFKESWSQLLKSLREGGQAILIGIGKPIIDLLRGPLSLIVKGLTGLVSLFQKLPAPVQQGAAALVALGGAVYLASGPFGMIAAAILGVVAALSWLYKIGADKDQLAWLEKRWPAAAKAAKSVAEGVQSIGKELKNFGIAMGAGLDAMFSEKPAQDSKEMWTMYVKHVKSTSPELYKSLEGVKESFLSIGQAGKRLLESIGGLGGDIWNSLTKMAEPAAEFFGTAFAVVSKLVGQAINDIASVIEAFRPGLVSVIDVFSELGKQLFYIGSSILPPLGAAFGVLLDVIKVTFQIIGALFSGAMAIVGPVIKFVLKGIGLLIRAFTWLFDLLATPVLKAFGEGLSKIGSVFSWIIWGISSALGGIVSIITAPFETAYNILTKTWPFKWLFGSSPSPLGLSILEGITSVGKSIIGSLSWPFSEATKGIKGHLWDLSKWLIKTPFKMGWDLLENFGIIDKIKDKFATLWFDLQWGWRSFSKSIAGPLSTLWGSLKENVGGAFKQAWGALKGLDWTDIKTLKDSGIKVFGEMKDIFKKGFGDFWKSGALQTIGNKVSDFAGKAFSYISGPLSTLGSKVKDALGGIWSKIGEGGGLVKTFQSGFEKLSTFFAPAFESLWGKIATTFPTVAEKLTSWSQTVIALTTAGWGTLVALWTKGVDWIKDKSSAAWDWIKGKTGIGAATGATAAGGGIAGGLRTAADRQAEINRQWGTGAGDILTTGRTTPAGTAGPGTTIPGGPTAPGGPAKGGRWGRAKGWLGRWGGTLLEGGALAAGAGLLGGEATPTTGGKIVGALETAQSAAGLAETAGGLAKGGSKLAAVGGIAGKAAGPLTALVEGGLGFMEGEERGRGTGGSLARGAAKATGAGLGAWGGAAAGAAIGSIIPGVGTAIGGVVGAIVGGLGGGKIGGFVDDVIFGDDPNSWGGIIHKKIVDAGSAFKSLASKSMDLFKNYTPMGMAFSVLEKGWEHVSTWLKGQEPELTAEMKEKIAQFRNAGFSEDQIKKMEAEMKKDLAKKDGIKDSKGREQDLTDQMKEKLQYYKDMGTSPEKLKQMEAEMKKGIGTNDQMIAQIKADTNMTDKEKEAKIKELTASTANKMPFTGVKEDAAYRAFNATLGPTSAAQLEGWAKAANQPSATGALVSKPTEVAAQTLSTTVAKEVVAQPVMQAAQIVPVPGAAPAPGVGGKTTAIGQAMNAGIIPGERTENAALQTVEILKLILAALTGNTATTAGAGRDTSAPYGSSPGLYHPMAVPNRSTGSEFASSTIADLDGLGVMGG